MIISIFETTKSHIQTLKLALIMMFASAAPLLAKPTIFWVSNPAQPGETVMVVGDSLGEKPVVEVMRIPDGAAGAPSEKAFAWSGRGQRAEILQDSEGTVKFLLPGGQARGVFAFRISTTNGTAGGLLNRPALWWAQGDLGGSASAGGWLEVFGKNLGPSGSAPTGPAMPIRDRPVTLLLRGPKEIRLAALGDGYAAKADLPKDLPAGEYRIYAHNGFGGVAGWSDAGAITVEKPKAWPQQVFNVRDFGAVGNGLEDDTPSVQSALAQARANGGGIVYFPRGRYLMTTPLEIPRFTVLRGEKREWVNLLWKDMQAPPEAFIRGTNSFGIEEMTLYCDDYWLSFIIADDKGPDAGDVFLRRVCIRADAFREGVIGLPDEANRRLRGLLKRLPPVNTMGAGWYSLVTMGGRNLRITDCDLYSSDGVVSLANARGALIQRNIFNVGASSNGFFAGDRIVVEDNVFEGRSPMAWGNAAGYGNLSNLYWGRNTHRLHYGGDREAITMDGPGGLYYGPAVANGVSLTLPEPPAGAGSRFTGKRPSLVGSAAYIVDGKGTGQWRRVLRLEGATLTLDRPWDVPPDATSKLEVTFSHDHYLVADNRFFDVGESVLFYGGPCMEPIAARNYCERGFAITSVGKAYGGYKLPPTQNPCHQVNWYAQLVDNTIAEGNTYGAGLAYPQSSDSLILVAGWALTHDWPWPYNRAAIVRGNILMNNARIKVGGTDNQFPLAVDTVVENNSIANSDMGIELDKMTAGVLVRNNRFDHVMQPLAGAGVVNAVIPSAQRAAAELAAFRAAAHTAGLTDDPESWPGVREALARLGSLPAGSPEVAPATAKALAAMLTVLAARKRLIPLDAAGPLLGLQVTLAPESTLPAVLQAGEGGKGTIAVMVSARPEVADWRAWVTLSVRSGWEVRNAGPISLGAGQPTLIRVNAPPGTWGRVTFPVMLTVTLPETEVPLATNGLVKVPGKDMSLPEAKSRLAKDDLVSVPGENLRIVDLEVPLVTHLTAGSSFLRKWNVIGPFPNKSGTAADTVAYPPEERVDLRAEYDGIGGKVRWQFVQLTDNWLNLTKQFGTGKEPGVAYAAAQVYAKQETPAVLRLGSAPGVTLIFNGKPVWSAWPPMYGARPDQEHVPLTLQPGMNVFLFKLSSPNGDWRFTAEVTPVTGDFGDNVHPAATQLIRVERGR